MAKWLKEGKSEKEIVEADAEVKKTVEKLQDKKFVEEGYLDPPKSEESKNWKKVKKNYLIKNA